MATLIGFHEVEDGSSGQAPGKKDPVAGMKCSHRLV